MTSLFPSVRAAEEFDRVLTGTATPAAAERHADLLAAVAIMRAQPELTPRAAFASELRERLLLAAQTELVAAAHTPRLALVRSPSTGSRQRRLGSVAASLVILGGSAGMAAAASGALPGDSLYPIKRGTEKLNAALRVNEASKGRVLLVQAENRLAEVGDLVASGADTDVVTSTVEAFTVAADSGSEKLFVSFQREGDPADITAVRDFAAQQMAEIGKISSSPGAGIDGALVEAVDTLADIDQAALVLCRTCGPTDPVALPSGLSAGAAPIGFQSLLTSPQARVQEVLDADEVTALQRAAEKAAGRTPSAPAAAPGATGTEPTPPRQVPGTVSPEGKLLPSLSVNAAVKDLVTGVTSTVKGLPGADKATGTTPGDPEDLVKGTVEGTLDGLDDAVGGVTDKLVP